MGKIRFVDDEFKFDSRLDAVSVLLKLIRPLKGLYSKECAYLFAGSSGAHYGERSKLMEGYARVLWGVGPLISVSCDDYPLEVRKEIQKWKKIAIKGLVNGTDPDSREYWGHINDYDQKMVEAAAIVNMLYLSGDLLWDGFTEKQKENIYNWLNELNSHKIHANNWRFFRILVNMLFKLKGLPVNEKNIEDDLSVINNCYMGDGWYFDGHPGQKDYYIAFAFHYYGLIYSKAMKDVDPYNANLFLERGKAFFNDYLCLFNEEGEEVAYGRSLIYRFAHAAYFSAYIFANEDDSERISCIKKMIEGNLKNWLTSDIYDNAGVLSLGYKYQDQFMTERYNAPGSPYWALKTFLFLALPDDHIFWKTKSKGLKLPAKVFLEKAGMLITRDQKGNVFMYPVGQKSGDFGATREKYQKFVYGNRSGFSVSRGTGLEDGAFDNCLAACYKDDDCYRMQNDLMEFKACEDYTETSYMLLPGVKVTSRIVPESEGHMRIHLVETKYPIKLADGGFAFPKEFVKGYEVYNAIEEITKDEKNCSLIKPEEANGNVSLSQARCLDDLGKVRVISAFPNASLMYPLTMIPTVIYELEAGKYELKTFFKFE
ncbi:MAG: DUF2264 domain-containing protein [Lachnospiraceae bacterium]|nr:DUF2264 domain-containing protein [Lachnospiraceae bacterium]